IGRFAPLTTILIFGGLRSRYDPTRERFAKPESTEAVLAQGEYRDETYPRLRFPAAAPGRAGVLRNDAKSRNRRAPRPRRARDAVRYGALPGTDRPAGGCA